MSDSNTMLMEKGHRPTPASSPFCVSVRPNSRPHASMENARRMKQNEVAVSAAEHTAKVVLASLETGIAPLTVAAAVLMILSPRFYSWIRPSSSHMCLNLSPRRLLSGFQNCFDESHDASSRDDVRCNHRRLGSFALFQSCSHLLREIRVELRERFDEAFG